MHWIFIAMGWKVEKAEEPKKTKDEDSIKIAEAQHTHTKNENDETVTEKFPSFKCNMLLIIIMFASYFNYA